VAQILGPATLIRVSNGLWMPSRREAVFTASAGISQKASCVLSGRPCQTIGTSSFGVFTPSLAPIAQEDP
jgi:hypothetical protein